MVHSMASDMDRNCAIEGLTKFFIRNCGSEKPTPRGIFFADTYSDGNFRDAPSRRGNDCYVSVNYRYNARGIDAGGRGLALGDYMGRT